MADVDFDDLIPKAAAGDVSFDDLVPQRPAEAPRYAADGVTTLAPMGEAPVAPPAAPRTLIDTIMDIGGYANQTAAVGVRGARKGLSALLGAPVDLANLGLGAVGLPVSSRPIGGSGSIDQALGVPVEMGSALSNAVGVPSNPDPQPQDPLQRVVSRIGYEVGANAVPVAGAMIAAPARTAAGWRAVANAPTAPAASAIGQLGQDIAGGARNVGAGMAEAAAVAPAQFIGRETALATAAGTGAGIANEAVGNPQQGDNFWSDFFGSLAGVGTFAGVKAAGGAIGNTISGATGTPRFVDDVVGREAADRIINNSSQMGDMAAARGGTLDTAPLSAQLRRPAPIEEAVPGYQANIADRTQDPGLASFAFSTDAGTSGPQAMRRATNEASVNARMDATAPAGDPAVLRAELEAARTREIAQAEAQRVAAEQAATAAEQSVQPALRDGTARGATLRDAIQDAFDRISAEASQKWAPINQADQMVDVAPLADRFGGVDANLSQAERMTARPAVAGVPRSLAGQADTAPVETGLVDLYGAPIVRPPDPLTAQQPLREVTGLRSALGDEVRGAQASSQPNQARIGREYIDQVDQFLQDVVPPELREQFSTAREATRDLKERFTRPGTAMERTLRQREGGGYRLDDSAVAPQFAQPDQGRINDYRSLMKEAGDDPRAKGALTDEILSDVNKRGIVNRPEALAKYMEERSIMLSDFPDLRQKLEAAGAARGALTAAEDASKATQRRLTTPGQSATANYLQYGDERTVDAIRTVVSSPKPAEAARELLAAAGNTPEARLNARAALWEDVKARGRLQAPGATGEVRWNGKKLEAMFRDPKVDAVAKELWSDAPEELADVKKLFSALAGAEGSTRARSTGSSGTAQALSGKFDPSLSAASIASRARSVNRGQLSPTIAAIDILGTWMRNRSAQVQSRAIDQITAAAVNNPGMAADLLDRFNPADYAARRRVISQKYGVRATQLLNLLDEAQGADETVDAVMEGRK